MWKFFDLLDSSSEYKHGVRLSCLGVAYSTCWEIKIAPETNVVAFGALPGRLLVSCPMVRTLFFVADQSSTCVIGIVRIVRVRETASHHLFASK